jgi:hypothetical protein
MPRNRRRSLLVLHIIATLVLVACGDDDSLPQALSFSPGVKVGGLCCLLYTPEVAVDGDRVFVAWNEAIRYTKHSPLYRSNDGGSSFPDELTFLDPSLGKGDQGAVRLATTANALNLVWMDSRDGSCSPFCSGYGIYSTHSVDGGASFALNRPVAAAAPGVDQIAPAQAVGGNGDVFVVWQEKSLVEDKVHLEIRFARSLNGGQSYEPALRVDAAGSIPCYRLNPAIALAASGSIYVAWLDERSGRPEVLLARSVDRGARFSIEKPIHPTMPDVTDRSGAQLAVTASGRLVAAWTEQRNGRWSIQYAMSLDGGLSFTAPRPVDGTAAQADQTLPALAVHGSETAYVAWQDQRNSGTALRAARSNDGGETFGPSVAVGDAAQSGPSLAVDARGNLLVVWINRAVYFARSR